MYIRIWVCGGVPQKSIDEIGLTFAELIKLQIQETTTCYTRFATTIFLLLNTKYYQASNT